MKVVTSGLNFLDIDAYAGCVAYAELLNLQNIDAVAISSANINDSVSNTIRSWNAPIVTKYTPNSNDSFVLIDVSEPDFLDRIVDIARVEEVIDHHVGYEKFWSDKIGLKTNIDFIGAACTLVYERWQEHGSTEQMSETSARLLISGILDNTLNFKSKVTTDRDHRAYDQLLKLANLSSDWTEQYFQECEESIYLNIVGALTNDTKIMKFRQLDSDNVAFGQLVVWDANKATQEYRNIIEETMCRKSDDWFINAVSISDGKSFFIASNDKVIEWAESLLGVVFNKRLAIADRLWLRKEIVKQDVLYVRKKLKLIH